MPFMLLSSTSNTSTTPRISNNNRRKSRGKLFDSQEAFFFNHLQKPSLSIKQLKQIHSQIIRNRLSHNQFLLTNLFHRLCLSMEPLHIKYATLVFHQIHNPLTFTWNLIIRINSSTSHQSLLLYTLMILRGVPPDKFTFPFLIKASSLSSSLHQGKQVHALAIKSGFSTDIFVYNTLMDFYFKCGDSDCARKVFDKMRVRTVVSWTTFVSGLISCGELETARGFFEIMPVRNVVSWTAMINGYVTNQQPHEAFRLFRRMELDNVRPNEFTLVSLLVACTQLGSLKLGRWIHDFAINNGFELGVFLGTALIDMYSKCGSLEDAKNVFDVMKERSLATWNSMITSLGVHGQGEEALSLFAKMEKETVQPDAITFLGVLCACVITDEVVEGCRYFKYMTEHYGIKPSVEHYSCMVRLFSRVGMLDEAYELVRVMPVKPNDDIWGILLRASRAQGNVVLEEVVYDHVRHQLSSTLSAASQHHNREFKSEVG